ncbi:hypothetical protein QUH15_28485, partial [Klebsiella pneumoniae]|nr:hypothetical protein [Klebsiella pneumoniae]
RSGSGTGPLSVSGPFAPGASSALDFTRMALNQEKYLDDFTWKELNDVINFIRKAEGSASDHSYALQLLEINFKANPL